MSLLDTLRRWLHRLSRTREAQTDRDGVLSYSGEVHAVAVGAMAGLLTSLVGPWVAVVFVAALVAARRTARLPDHIEDASKELAYTGAAFTVLWFVGTVALLLV